MQPMEELVKQYKQKKKEKAVEMLTEFGNYLRQNYTMNGDITWIDDVEGIIVTSKDIAEEFLLDYDLD